MVDHKRSKKIKKDLNNNYLFGKEYYPDTILIMRRLMADYNNDGYKMKSSSGADELRDSGVAFAKWKPNGPCHACGTTNHPGGWKQCPNVLDEHKKQVGKLIAAGAFKFKPGNGTGGNGGGGGGGGGQNSSSNNITNK